MKSGVSCVLALVLLASPVLAAEPFSEVVTTEAPPPPDRAETLVVYGDDPCPEVEGDEIVVCARKPEDERYRIPKELRGKDDEPMETSFASRMAAVEEATRDTWGAGCSVVGSGGLNGCFAESLRRWLAERQAVKTAP